MNDKYSLAKCAQYGRRLAARLCDQHFGSQPTVTLDGPAILKFTPVRQLNLLVVRQLLSQWQSETARLRSPYFDFEAIPVQAALTQFMNVLSRHIRLDRSAFEPLLAAATADTLGIVADPSGTFQRLLLGELEHPTAEALRGNLRYFDVDKEFYQGFVAVLPHDTVPSRESLQKRFELYHAANYKAHQPMQRLVGELSNLLPLTSADLLEDGPASVAAVPAPAPASIPASIPAPHPATTVSPATEAPDPPQPPVAFASQPSPDPVVPLHEKLKPSQGPVTPLAEALRASAPTGVLAERGPKVETLREAISINQRFSFINELFNGENMDYHAAIQHLDSLPTADEARAYVTGPLAQRYDWGRKEEHVNKLLKLIERKFA